MKFERKQRLTRKSVVYLKTIKYTSKSYQMRAAQNQTSQLMNNFRLNLLERINHGDLIYSAAGSDKESLREFERVANALLDFEAAGLIEIQSRVSEIVNGKEYAILIAVRRLTAAGKRSLKAIR